MSNKGDITYESFRHVILTSTKQAIENLRLADAFELKRDPGYLRTFLTFIQRAAAEPQNTGLMDGAIQFFICIHELAGRDPDLINRAATYKAVRETYNTVMNILLENDCVKRAYLASRILNDAEYGDKLFEDCERDLEKELKGFGQDCIEGAERYSHVESKLEDNMPLLHLQDNLEGFGTVIVSLASMLPSPSPAMDIILRNYKETSDGVSSFKALFGVLIDTVVAGHLPKMLEISRVAVENFSSRMQQGIAKINSRVVEDVGKFLDKLERENPEINPDFTKALVAVKDKYVEEVQRLGLARHIRRPQFTGFEQAPVPSGSN